jgi:hypothetical protein
MTIEENLYSYFLGGTTRLRRYVWNGWFKFPWKAWFD